jgi:molybdate transport system substrate-binding protein
MKRRVLLFAALLLPCLGAATARAEDILVVSSGGFAAAYKELAPAFEKATGNTLVAEWGPSMGNTKDAVPQRLARNEPIDVVIMVGYALGKLVDAGKIAPADRRDLAESGIGVVVKAGAPHPDVSTIAGLKAAIIAAPSIAYSDSASGVYIQNEMFKKLGVEEQVRGKAWMIPAEPVGAVVARGEAALGFQQISELKPITGIDLVGPLPQGAQQITVFSGGVLERSTHKAAARALLAFLSSPAAADAIRRSGMDPMTTNKE